MNAQPQDVQAILVRIEKLGSQNRRVKQIGSAVLLVVAMASFVLAGTAQAKKLKLPVRIFQTQTTSGTGMYTIPGYGSTNCNISDYGSTAYVNCLSTNMPAQAFTYTVQGATLSLLLPDDSIVVVTCQKKLNWTEWSMAPYRDCRIPVMSDLTAEFDGDKAKLEWNVSLDGSKKRSETYKVVGVLTKLKDGK